MFNLNCLDTHWNIYIYIYIMCLRSHMSGGCAEAYRIPPRLFAFHFLHHSSCHIIPIVQSQFLFFQMTPCCMGLYIWKRLIQQRKNTLKKEIEKRDLKEWPNALISGTINPFCDKDLGNGNVPSKTSSLVSSEWEFFSPNWDPELKSIPGLNYKGASRNQRMREEEDHTKIWLLNEDGHFLPRNWSNRTPMSLEKKKQISPIDEWVTGVAAIVDKGGIYSPMEKSLLENLEALESSSEKSKKR